MDLSQSLAGFFVGALVGLTGVGGGSLMTPLLVLLFGIHPATAVGTDLLYAAITKAAGTALHSRRGNVDWPVVANLAAGSVPAAAATILLLSRLGIHSQAAGSVMSVVLAGALLLTAVSLFLRHRLLARIERTAPAAARPVAATVATGAVLGVLVTSSSVGAGAVGVTALLFLYPALPLRRIVGTDIAHAVPLTLVAGLGHWWLGSIDWRLLASLLAGSLPGIWLGSQLAARIPERALRPTLATLLLAVAGKLILQ